MGLHCVASPVLGLIFQPEPHRLPWQDSGQQRGTDTVKALFRTMPMPSFSLTKGFPFFNAFIPAQMLEIGQQVKKWQVGT